MHCPNCGKPATKDQQFCRSCGMNLESVGTLVAQHSTMAPTSPKAEKLRAEQEILRSMFTAMMIGMAILFTGLLLLVVNKTFSLGAAVSLVATFLLVGGTGYATFAILNAVRKNALLGMGKPQPQLTPAKDKSLPTNSFPEALPSVTERTTQLISSSGTEQEQEVK